MNQKTKFKKGRKIEEHIQKLIPRSNLTSPYEYYDLETTTKNYIEIKSAELRNSMGKNRGTKWGRFIVIQKNHEQLVQKHNDKAWYALALTFKNEPVIIRFRKAKEIRIKKYPTNSYMPLHELYSGLELKQFLEEIKKDQT